MDKIAQLKTVPGRVVVKVNMQEKNSHTFSDGQTIRLERGPNNLNQRETQPVQGEVIDSEYIPKGSIILFQHNGCQPTYRIFNYKPLSGADIASDIQYFSLPENACYLFRHPKSDIWWPLKGFETGLRVYQPYFGIIQGIEPVLIKNRLFITSGHLGGKAVMTVRSSDYQIVFQGVNGQEENIIRCRHWENPEDDIEGREEIMMIDDELTDRIFKSEILIGLTPGDAKNICELANLNKGVVKLGYGY